MSTPWTDRVDPWTDRVDPGAALSPCTLASTDRLCSARQSRGHRPRRGASGSRANTPSDAGRQSPGAASTCSASSSSEKSRTSSNRPRPAATAKRAGTHLDTPDAKAAKKKKGVSYVSGERREAVGGGGRGRKDVMVVYFRVCEPMGSFPGRHFTVRGGE